MPSNFNLNSLDDFQKNNSNYFAHDSKSSNASNGSLYSNYNSNDLLKTKENENRRTSSIKNNMKKLNPIPKLYAKSHFSPQTSIRIKVIDELDGD